MTAETDPSSDHPVTGLDEVVHQRVRLGILAIAHEARRVEGWIGKLNPARATRIQQAYPLAFFDRHLRGARSRLLDGPSRAFPEVGFLP